MNPQFRVSYSSLLAQNEQLPMTLQILIVKTMSGEKVLFTTIYKYQKIYSKSIHFTSAVRGLLVQYFFLYLG